MNKKWKFILFTPLLCLGLVFVPFFVARIWYGTFRHQYERIVPLLVSQNEVTFQELQPPEGVEIIFKGDGSSISSFYGAMMLVDYKITNSNSDKREVWKYYKKMLDEKGWVQVETDIGTGYFQNDRCIIIFPYPFEANTETYTIRIWHDYISQDFTPRLPPFWLMALFEYGYTDTAECP